VQADRGNEIHGGSQRDICADKELPIDIPSPDCRRLPPPPFGSASRRGFEPIAPPL
jgi:hypothetical protein